MYQLLSQLQEIIKEHPFEKKIMIVPSQVDGSTFKKTICLRGLRMVNFQYTTLFDLARTFSMEDLIQEKLNLLDNTLGTFITTQILKELSDQEKLNYFQLPQVTPGLAKTIYQTIKEVRAVGYTVNDWFINAQSLSGKIKDLQLVMAEYEKQLEDRKLVDEARLYSLAIQGEYPHDGTIFLAPSNLQMNPLEQMFFDKKIRPSAFILELTCSEAVVAPETFPLAKNHCQNDCLEKRILDFLHYQEMNSIQLPDVDLNFFHSQGEFAESKEVLRMIIKNKIPFDQVQILYTSQEPYSQFFYQLIYSLRDLNPSPLQELPATFHGGIHLKNSHPGQFLYDFLEWLIDDYSIKKLFMFLNSGNMDLQLPDYFSIKEFAALLRNSSIGWGRSRYIPGIQLAIQERKEMMGEASSEQKEVLQLEIKKYKIIENWLNDIFKHIPEGNLYTRVSLKDMVRGIGEIVNKYSVLKDKLLDIEALSKINQGLSVLEKNTVEDEKISFSETLSIISDQFSKEHICCSSPCPGKIHISSYKKGAWIDRPYLFLIGMDAQKFPGMVDDGTVFMEREQRPYRHLLTNTQKNTIEQLKILHIVLSRRKNIYLSYSCLDPINNQIQAPAEMLLQLYRLNRKNLEIGYEEFYQDLGKHKTLIPEKGSEAIDHVDLFLYFSRNIKKEFKPFFQQRHPFFIQGGNANLIRHKEELNVYNGKIRLNKQRFDPRINRGIVLSSSKLERVAICPYLYFLKDILKIKPPEEIEYEPTQWLSPMERGLLLHQIYEKFYQTFMINSKGKPEPPTYHKHWNLLEKIILEHIEEKKKFLAPPTEVIYQAEKREILESCQVFLSGEENNYKGQIPQYFELAFGTRDNEHKILGKIKAIEFLLPAKGRISFQGKIDRVDRMSDQTFRIIDYKTGNSDDYKKNKPFRNGQQIQHALYALSFEKIFGKIFSYNNCLVSESGYYFPTPQGKGRLILYKQENKEMVLEVVEILLDMISDGNFPMTQSSDHYLCQDYQDIMEQNEIIQIHGKDAEKYKDEPALDGLRQLKEYE